MHQPKHLRSRKCGSTFPMGNFHFSPFVLTLFNPPSSSFFKLKKIITHPISWQFLLITTVWLRTCLWYRFCNKHLPSSHHPIFYCLVSHSTSNHIQRLMLQSVPYRFCKLVESFDWFYLKWIKGRLGVLSLGSNYLETVLR